MRLMLVLFVLLVAVNAMAVTAAGSGDPVCAKNFTVLHKGPGVSFPVSWRVSRYMPFFRNESKNGWVKVQDLEGETHWAPSHDLSSGSGMHCVVVRSAVATLRKEPSANAPLSDLKTLDRYTPLKKLDVKGEWIQVEDETERKAWIHDSNVWRPMRVQSVTF